MKSRHNTRIFFTLIALLVITSACSPANSPNDSTNNAVQDMDALVTTQWLSEHLDDPDLVVLDCTVLIEQDEKGGIRSVSGRDKYEAGHIPGAGFADLMGDLSAVDNNFTFIMPTPEQFSEAMGALGVGNNSRVVLYTANIPDWAARVWWMLRWVGFDQVALLDGGLDKWVAEDRPLSTEPAERLAKQLNTTLRPDTIAYRDEVFTATNDSDINIVDALPDAHFRGEFAMYDRPGHILGATNMPSSDLLDAEGYYRSIDELELVYDGDERSARVITYCGGGISASSVAFTMHRLGFSDVAVYMDSLQEWAADPDNPMSRATQ
jgi:thiosulfate/3-mercaptopyruvate sulfurtransferase